MSIAVRVEPLVGNPSDVEYRWDTDTDILTANLRTRAAGDGASGSVEIEGSDGSWLILDLNGGSVHGVEVAVWPEVRKRSALAPPSETTDGRVMPLSLPDSRWDKMVYGIRDCEEFLRSLRA